MAASTAGLTAQSLSSAASHFESIVRCLVEAAKGGRVALPDVLSEVGRGLKAREKKKLGAPEIPRVTWEDVGGLLDARRAIQETIELPLKYPWLFQGGERLAGGRNNRGFSQRGCSQEGISLVSNVDKTHLH